MESFFEGLKNTISSGSMGNGDFMSWVMEYSRYVLAILALAILARCLRSMLREKYEPETWAYINIPDDQRVPVRHWEFIIGRARSSDIVVDYPTVSRSHAAVIRDDDGNWKIIDLDSQGGTFINGDPVEGFAYVEDGDTIALADTELHFESLTVTERAQMAEQRKAPGRSTHPGATFFMITVFQTVIALQHSLTAEAEYVLPITMSFFALCAAMWCYYLVMRGIRRMGFEVEQIAFFLTTLGFSVAASSVPEDMGKQVALFLAGMVLFLALGWWLRDLGRTKKLRWPAAAAALGLLAINLVLAQEAFGAKNWIEIGGITIQPSEFVKIAYIYTGAATLDRLYTGRNLLMYIGFSAACVGALALMGDFGTALVFFVTFLIISYMRSGNLATIVLAVTGAGLAGFLMLTIKPHIAQRFATWGHVWEYANEGGYQQTRALSAAASGGFFGQGCGNGWLHTVFAADTDMVFCLVCEELGLIVALAAFLAVVVLAAFTVKNAASGRSSFYVIAACATVSMLMVQLSLNVFGSLDILPFTGVTFPFVSRGGSSLISCWGMMAFIKASDTRKNASFTTKLTSRRMLRRLARQEALEDGAIYGEDEAYDEYDDAPDDDSDYDDYEPDYFGAGDFS